jgi:hypothetical protein
VSDALRRKKREKLEMARRAADEFVQYMWETQGAQLYRKLLTEGSVDFDMHLPRHPAVRRVLLEQLQLIGAP